MSQAAKGGFFLFQNFPSPKNVSSIFVNLLNNAYIEEDNT